jgi:hypothetical protein
LSFSFNTSDGIGIGFTEVLGSDVSLPVTAVFEAGVAIAAGFFDGLTVGATTGFAVIFSGFFAGAGAGFFAAATGFFAGATGFLEGTGFFLAGAAVFFAGAAAFVLAGADFLAATAFLAAGLAFGAGFLGLALAIKFTFLLICPSWANKTIFHRIYLTEQYSDAMTGLQVTESRETTWIH